MNGDPQNVSTILLAERITTLATAFGALQLDLQRRQDANAAAMTDITSVLHSLSAALSASSQITAAERDQVLQRLDQIIGGLNQDRRDYPEMLRRLEGNLQALQRDFSDFLDERGETMRHFHELCANTRQVLEATTTHHAKVEAIAKEVRESLQILRSGNGRNQDTGAKDPLTDRLVHRIIEATLNAFATAAALMVLAKLLPWVGGLASLFKGGAR